MKTVATVSSASGDAPLHQKLGLLPQAARDDFYFWRQRIEPLLDAKKGVVAQLKAIATATNTPFATVRGKFYAAKKSGLEALIDRRLAGPAWWNTSQRIGLPAEDQKLVKTYCENSNLSTAEALRKLRRDWRQGRVTSTQEVDPVTGYPRGWSIDNLREYAPSKFELKSFRIGKSSAFNLGAQVLMTRANLWVGSHYMFDDVIHDNFVRYGTSPKVGRPMELGVLDVFSGARFCWGSKLWYENDEGKKEGLKKQNMLLVSAAAMHGFGYSERGTVLMGEHGTAKIYDKVAKVLYDCSEGRIVVREPGITGEEQAVIGWWPGSGKGNPRFKSPLEVVHRLMHVMLDDVPGQTGPDRQRRPEALAGMLAYTEEVMTLAQRIPQHMQTKLMLPLLEYFTQWLPLVDTVYQEMNGRDWHNLEGWAAARLFTTAYRIDARSEDWITQDQFLALPHDAQAAINHAVALAPRLHSKTRKMSPAEVHQRGRADLKPIPAYAVCQLLEDDFTREGERVDGAYFVFQDKEIAPEELMYEARIRTLAGATHELRDGERYNVIVNPFDPECLFVMDGRNSFLGIAPRVQRVCRTDEEAIQKACGQAASRNVERLSGLRERHAAQAQHIQTMRENNARIIDGVPAAPKRSPKKEQRDANKRQADVLSVRAALARQISEETTLP